MITLMDLGNEILKVREAIDGVEVKGNENRSRISYAYEKCNRLIAVINQTTQEIQNGNQEAGENHGQLDSGPAESDS